jgi:hypothetical protein
LREAASSGFGLTKRTRTSDTDPFLVETTKNLLVHSEPSLDGSNALRGTAFAAQIGRADSLKTSFFPCLDGLSKKRPVFFLLFFSTILPNIFSKK